MSLGLTENFAVNSSTVSENNVLGNDMVGNGCLTVFSISLRNFVENILLVYYLYKVKANFNPIGINDSLTDLYLFQTF